jgi:hypothetical protein
MARVYAEMERERVDAYILPIFQRYGFTYGSIAGDEAGQPLKSPKHLFLCEDEERVREYFEDCDVAHRAHGFTGPKGHCPALIAEHLVITTENLLIDLASEQFHADFHGLFGKDRERLLDLLIGAALKAEAEGKE